MTQFTHVSFKSDMLAYFFSTYPYCYILLSLAGTALEFVFTSEEVHCEDMIKVERPD